MTTEPPSSACTSVSERPTGGRPDPELVDELFASYAQERSWAIRNQLVELHMGLAMHIARRFGRGRSGTEDLEQVALLGLLKAVERFDPARGVTFGTFAGRTIEGEIKRHLRDTTWEVHVPRSLKDLHVSVRSVSEELAQRLGRAPSTHEIADELDVGTDDVLEALATGTARTPESIDAPAGVGGTDHTAALGVGGGYADVENSYQVERLVAELPEREREIVRLRFEEHLSQDAIAEHVGISQMHVSRLLRRSLDALREAAGRDRVARDV